MTMYQDLHFFIDETGQFRGAGDQRLSAVGGLLVFGKFDAPAQYALEQLLVQHMEAVGGTFPKDLHYHASTLRPEKRDIFVKALGQSIKDWLASKDDLAIYGIAMTYKEAMFRTSMPLLDERARDNRYIAMLWALIEHIVFVDPKVAERLQPGWKLHLHIASRTIDLTAQERQEAQEMQALGYDVQAYKSGRRIDAFAKADKFLVHGTLNARDLMHMLRFSLQQRWSDVDMQLGSIDVDRIQYHPGEPTSSAGLYLADIFLGQFRHHELADGKLSLLNLFRSLPYGPWLATIAELAHAVRLQSIDRYLELREQLDSHDLDEASSVFGVVRHYDKLMHSVLQRHPHRLLGELEAASIQVDRPGQSSAGAAKASRAMQRLVAAGAVSPAAQVLHLQVQLSHANHMGDTSGADAHWGRMPEILAAGGGDVSPEQLAELYNRRAVSLTDRMRYDEARDVLVRFIQYLDEQREARSGILAQWGIPGGSQACRSLGACYGTLGQIEAFTGHLEQAASFFREAMPYFDAPRDIERQWVYLGHVACELEEPAAAKALWEEVEHNIPSLTRLDDMLQSGAQFVFALFLKSRYVFSSVQELASILEAVEALDPFGKFSAEDRRHHPFGLIHQLFGLCHERLHRAAHACGATSAHHERALAHYREAARLMQSGGPMLAGLGYAAELRQALLQATAHPDPVAADREVGRAFQRMRGHLQVHFGDPAWSEDAHGRSQGYFGEVDPGQGHGWCERAGAVLYAIRFNYW